MGKLTALEVKAALKSKKVARLIDGEGLRLTIDAKGRAYWVLRVMVAGKDMERSLGKGDGLSLTEAREKARETRKALLAAIRSPNDGADLSPNDVSPKAPVREIPTFEKAARDHHAVIAPTLKNAKHAAQWLSSLESYIFPTFGQKQVDEVDEGDISEAILKIWTSKRETASRVKQRVRAVLSAAKGRGWRSVPIDWDAVDAALPRVRKIVEHMASVPFERVPAFHKALGASSSVPAVRAALAFLIFSTVRPGNIVTAEWSHIDREARTWTIPGELMKGGIPHRVFMTDGALAALDVAAAHRTSRSELIFPGRDGVSPLSADALRMAMRRMGEDATPHGFRSSFKDWSLHNDYPDHLSERQLAHIDPNEVRRAYARTDLFDQRRDMMEAWDRFVRGG